MATTVNYEVRNGNIESVKIDADYARSRQVPTIGHRRRMQVNGGSQLMTLNRLEVNRWADWNEDRGRFLYRYRTKEEWGEYYIS